MCDDRTEPMGMGHLTDEERELIGKWSTPTPVDQAPVSGMWITIGPRRSFTAEQQEQMARTDDRLAHLLVVVVGVLIASLLPGARG